MGADRFEKELAQLLHEHQAELIQEKPHRKWRLPDEQVFTISSTASDHRAVRNQLRDLRRLLGIKRAVNYVPQSAEADRRQAKLAEKRNDTAHDEILIELDGATRPDLLSELMEAYGGE